MRGNSHNTTNVNIAHSGTDCLIRHGRVSFIGNSRIPLAELSIPMSRRTRAKGLTLDPLLNIFCDELCIVPGMSALVSFHVPNSVLGFPSDVILRHEELVRVREPALGLVRTVDFGDSRVDVALAFLAIEVACPPLDRSVGAQPLHLSGIQLAAAARDFSNTIVVAVVHKAAESLDHEANGHECTAILDDCNGIHRHIGSAACGVDGQGFAALCDVHSDTVLRDDGSGRVAVPLDVSTHSLRHKTDRHHGAVCGIEIGLCIREHDLLAVNGQLDSSIVCRSCKHDAECSHHNGQCQKQSAYSFSVFHFEILPYIMIKCLESKDELSFIL